MSARSLLSLAIVCIVMSTACRTAGASGGPTRDRNLITAEELMAVPHSSVFEAVRALRPRWMQARAGLSLTNPAQQTPRVYIDGQLRGELDEMWTILPGEVQEIRFMSASDATTRFGTNHIAGAIVITTRRR